MNLEKIIAPQITSIVPKKHIDLYIFNGQTVDAAGKTMSTYTPLLGLLAQVELTSQQRLSLMEGISITKIYKDFRLQSTDLTGLNRNISTAGDYIKMDNLYYRIIALPENFETGWVWVTGVQSTTIEDA
jgi:hypothetical protein